MNKIFSDELWTKNWSGQWGLPLATLYGDIYTSGIGGLVGKSLAHNLIIFESGTSSNYLIQRELTAHCEHLVSLITGDPAVAAAWSKQVIINTDKFFALIKKLDNKKTFNPEDFNGLQQARLAITVANFSIKKVIDYLPGPLMEKYLDLFTKTRLHSEPVYNEAERLNKKILGFLLKGKLTDQEILVLLKEELAEFFNSGQLPNKQLLTERYLGAAILYDQFGKFQIWQGSAYHEIMAAIVARLNNSQIKGTPAYHGSARGRVRIVLDPAKCADFKEGDILVAGMTRPEYLPLMRLSAAFITDAGGLLSHAAIVARELKKPCLVGTEIATKILKDGDLVEVNANEGIVKKIN